jgi:hypothetical protein
METVPKKPGIGKAQGFMVSLPWNAKVQRMETLLSLYLQLGQYHLYLCLPEYTGSPVWHGCFLTDKPIPQDKKADIFKMIRLIFKDVKKHHQEIESSCFKEDVPIFFSRVFMQGEELKFRFNVFELEMSALDNPERTREFQKEVLCAMHDLKDHIEEHMSESMKSWGIPSDQTVSFLIQSISEDIHGFFPDSMRQTMVQKTLLKSLHPEKTTIFH